MTNLLVFLPLAWWGLLAFAALYSIIETDLRVVAVLAAGLTTAARILIRRWKIAAALALAFASTPAVGFASAAAMKLAVAKGLLEPSVKPLILSAFVWKGIAAALIALIATFIHAHALPPAERTPEGWRRYRIQSVAAGLAVFLVLATLSVGSYVVIHGYEIPQRFRPDSFARIAQTLAFVPLALIRPALSLGLRNPVGAAFRAVAAYPVSMTVCVIALQLPPLLFETLGAGVVRAHPSVASVLAFQAASLAFAVFACAWFETATLLLLARKEKRLSFRRGTAFVAWPVVKAA